jgi:hypothetical protein
MEELESEHRKTERAKEFRKSIISEMKDYLGQFVNPNTHARVTDIPADTAKSSSTATNDCVKQMEYEADINIIEENVHLVVQTLNNITRHLQQCYPHDKDVARWPSLIGDSGTDLLTQYFTQSS